MFDLLCLGEILIDFAPLDGLYQPNPGGAPANVACAAAKLGLKSAFVGQVGPLILYWLCSHSSHVAFLMQIQIDKTRLKRLFLVAQATFRVLSSHVYLTATILDSRGGGQSHSCGEWKEYGRG